jgi:hypothetical protein
LKNKLLNDYSMINSGRVYATTQGDIGFLILGRQVERHNLENSAFLQNG